MKRKLAGVICLILGILCFTAYFLNLGKKSLLLTIKHADYIMPAAYKVYANQDALNGEYYLFKMLMKNNGQQTISNIKVSYRIPNYIEWTDLETIKEIYPGQNTVVRCYPQFKDDIVNKMTQSQEKVEIKISYDKDQSITEDYTFKMMGRNQFVYTDLPPEEIANYPDEFRNEQLLGSFVTPQDPIIKYYTQQVQEKVMKGEAASVTNKPEDAAKFLAGVYAATYMSHMVYSGTEGIPQKLGDINSLVQSIRLPREVVTGNTGLCIELSLLYASILKSAGLHPIIFMIPGHAYPGVLANGQYYAIEATGINGEGLGGRLSPEDALKAGMKELTEFMQNASAGDNRYTYVDLDDMEAKGVVPMELKDDQFLRKKIDDLSATFNGGSSNRPRQAESTVASTTDTASAGQEESSQADQEGGAGKGNGANTYTGLISFSYPKGWHRYDHPVKQKPYLLCEISPSDQTAAIDVINVSGAENSAQAIEYLRKNVTMTGGIMRYQQGESRNGYDFYYGMTTSANGINWKWEALFHNSSNGIVGILLGGVRFSQVEKTFNNVLSTVR